MSKLTLAVPSVGELNTVAEPKVDTALKEIETWANGNVGTNNIAAENVTEAMLAKAVQEKLTTRLGFILKKETVSFTAETEKYYEVEKAGATCTLPAPTLNRIIGVQNVLAGAAVKVTASSGKIYGDFIEGNTTVELLLYQHVIVIADGSNWLIIAGEPKRTAEWEAGVTRSVGVEYEPSATRPVLVSFKTSSAALVSVGGHEMGETAASGSVLFEVNPGQKWKYVGGGATGTSYYLVK